MVDFSALGPQGSVVPQNTYQNLGQQNSGQASAGSQIKFGADGSLTIGSAATAGGSSTSSNNAGNQAGGPQAGSDNKNANPFDRFFERQQGKAGKQLAKALQSGDKEGAGKALKKLGSLGQAQSLLKGIGSLMKGDMKGFQDAMKGFERAGQIGQLGDQVGNGKTELGDIGQQMKDIGNGDFQPAGSEGADDGATGTQGNDGDCATCGDDAAGGADAGGEDAGSDAGGDPPPPTE